MAQANNSDMHNQQAFYPTQQSFMSYFRHHGFALMQALKNIFATPFASLLTLTVIAFSVTLPLLLWVVLTNIQSWAQAWESTQITVFLQKNSAANTGQQLLQELQHDPRIARVVLISAEQGLKEFTQKMGLQQEVLSALPNNPLPDVLTIYPAGQTPEQITALVSALKTYPNVATVQLDMAWVQRLNAFTVFGQQIVAGLMVLLGMGVLLIIMNAIRATSQTAQVKIQVIRLIGGSNRFIRRPFLYTGLFYSLLGCALAILIVNYCISLLNLLLQPIADSYSIQITLQGLSAQLIYLTLLITAGLGYIGAWLSLSSQLTIIESHY